MNYGCLELEDALLRSVNTTRYEKISFTQNAVALRTKIIGWVRITIAVRPTYIFMIRRHCSGQTLFIINLPNSSVFIFHDYWIAVFQCITEYSMCATYIICLPLNGNECFGYFCFQTSYLADICFSYISQRIFIFECTLLFLYFWFKKENINSFCLQLYKMCSVS